MAKISIQRINQRNQINNEIIWKYLHCSPYCEEIRLLLIPSFSMCGEHEKQFMEYMDNLSVSPDLEELLENNKEAHFNFMLESLGNFFKKLEKEYHRKNKQVIKKKKSNTKAKQKKKNENRQNNYEKSRK
ncbi:hypothetical protein [Spiroplasma endosymbiont of Polydrusus cervinus]|uniref:hypothetical protein n=1 Tax=Spiroplasma endosymbiont of Polydrusus cervinus TaxID=3066287 RepID=UPI0030D32B97